MTPADWVTAGRACLGAVCAGLVVLTLVGTLPARSWALPLLLAPTIALDAVDGAVARRTGTVTARGARWDMEVDSAVLLVACVAVVPYAPWVLVMGLARYLFGVAGWLRGWRGGLPFSQVRRVIGGFQGVAIMIVLLPIVPLRLGQITTGVALVLLAYSFGVDVLHQERSRRRRVPG